MVEKVGDETRVASYAVSDDYDVYCESDEPLATRSHQQRSALIHHESLFAGSPCLKNT
jgi:hypothetical protein